MSLIEDLSVIGFVYPHFSGVIGRAIDKIAESRLNLDEDEKTIIDCMLAGWIETGMRIPGNISYQMVIELMQKFGVDPTPIESELKKFEK